MALAVPGVWFLGCPPAIPMLWGCFEKRERQMIWLAIMIFLVISISRDLELLLSYRPVQLLIFAFFLMFLIGAIGALLGL